MKQNEIVKQKEISMFGRNKSNKEGGQCHSPESKQTKRRDISRKDDSLNDAVPDAVAEIGRFFISMDRRLARLEMNLSEVLEARKEDLATIEACVRATADCQKYTAELANQNLERHALYPSIEAVASLTNIDIELSQQAKALMKNPQLDPSLTQLLRSIVEAAKIAKSKREQLGLESIRPEQLDAIDREKHEIVTAVTTNDKERHKKIHGTLTAGLIYRNKILRQARVSVYCFSNEKVTEQEDRKPECQSVNHERTKDESNKDK
jgi:molecular chaperone GrpE (heat shock protein)